MAEIFWGRSAYQRNVGNLPPLKLVNMFVEPSPTDDKGIVLLSRPGLASSYSVGSGPVIGLFQEAGVFSGDIFAISGTALYRATTSLGTVSGAGPASFAATALELLTARGGPISRTTGGAIADVSFPDSADVTAVAFLAGYFIAARADTHRFYWSAVLNGNSWNALDFASAESSPDRLVDLVVVNEELWLIGETTIEPWRVTGNSETPFIRNEGRLIDKGAYDTGCSVSLDNTLFWVSNEKIVYRALPQPKRMSDHAIEEQIAASSTVSAFGFYWQGHPFFCVRLDTQTLCLDVSTGEWSESATHALTNYRARCAVTVGDSPFLGDSENGTIWEWDGYQDGGQTLERLFTAAIPLGDQTLMIDNIVLETNAGQTPLLLGQGVEPEVEMRFSRDAGNTWSDWRRAQLGAQGNYRQRTKWRRLGTFDGPGAMFQFRVTDPVPWRVSDVRVNEPGGGRGRT